MCNFRPEMEYMYSPNDTVYFYDPYFKEFHMLYDFSAEPTDSWSIKIFDEMDTDTDYIWITVDSTDVITINDLEKKRFFVTYSYEDEKGEIIPLYNSTIVEQIGDVQFMFNFSAQGSWACDGNFSGGLRCYEDSTLGLYETGIVPYCDYIRYLTSVEKPNISSKQNILVLIDQVADIIHMNSEFSENVYFRIFDLSGKIENSGIITGSQIDIKKLDPGVFIIGLYNYHGIPLHTQKFVKY
jgi:hypothetical protein